MLKEIDNCKCGKRPEYVACSDIEPGRALNTYVCTKCRIVYQYDLVYPLVQSEHAPTLYGLRSVRPLGDRVPSDS